VLEFGERPIPKPGAQQVLVKVAAAGVNPIDRRLRNGELQDFFQRGWPIIPGWDVSGRIVEVGASVSDWQIGQDVAGLAFTWVLQHGSYAEYIVIDDTSIAPLPAELDYIQGAALPLVSLTAWQALDEFAHLGKDQNVLIQAGSGGVGSVAIAMAKHLGAKVYTTTRTENFDYVKARGADHPIDYTQENYVEMIRQHEPDGLDVVLESLTGDELVKDAIRLVKDGGSVPYLNNEPPEMNEIETRNINTTFIHHRPDGKMLHELMRKFADGTFMMPAISSMPLAEARQAQIQSESMTTNGKLVLTVN
jgi:NADPH2:quinone reductase